MTEQEIFNKAYIGVVQQGKPSKGSGCCLYRGPNGLKCAVGHILTDEEYNPKMEKKEVVDLVEEGLLPTHLRLHHDILTAIQTAHDKAAEEDDFLSTYIREMEKVAIRFDLEIPCNIPETTN